MAKRKIAKIITAVTGDQIILTSTVWAHGPNDINELAQNWGTTI